VLTGISKWDDTTRRERFDFTQFADADCTRVRKLAMSDRIYTTKNVWYNNCEEWLSTVCSTFPNLQEITIIISRGHDRVLTNDTMNTVDAQKVNLVFRKPLDFLRKINFWFRNYYEEPDDELAWDELYFTDGLRCFHDLSSSGSPPISLERLEARKQRRLGQGLPSWNSCPTIYCKIATTPAFGEKLDKVDNWFKQLPTSTQEDILDEDIKEVGQCRIDDDTSEPQMLLFS